MNARQRLSSHAQTLLAVLAALVAHTVARSDITFNLQVRYWFDEANGPSAADSSGNHRTGTLANGAIITNVGRFGGGVDMDGVDDFVDCPRIDETDSAAT